MTTSVNVILPTPNHKRVKIETIYLGKDDKEVVNQTIELEHGQTSATMHVHDGQFIKITEIE